MGGDGFWWLVRVVSGGGGWVRRLMVVGGFGGICGDPHLHYESPTLWLGKSLTLGVRGGECPVIPRVYWKGDALPRLRSSRTLRTLFNSRAYIVCFLQLRDLNIWEIFLMILVWWIFSCDGSSKSPPVPLCVRSCVRTHFVFLSPASCSSPRVMLVVVLMVICNTCNLQQLK